MNINPEDSDGSEDEEEEEEEEEVTNDLEDEFEDEVEDVVEENVVEEEGVASVIRKMERLEVARRWEVISRHARGTHWTDWLPAKQMVEEAVKSTLHLMSLYNTRPEIPHGARSKDSALLLQQNQESEDVPIFNMPRLDYHSASPSSSSPASPSPRSRGRRRGLSPLLSDEGSFPPPPINPSGCKRPRLGPDPSSRESGAIGRTRDSDPTATRGGGGSAPLGVKADLRAGSAGIKAGLGEDRGYACSNIAETVFVAVHSAAGPELKRRRRLSSVESVAPRTQRLCQDGMEMISPVKRRKTGQLKSGSSFSSQPANISSLFPRLNLNFKIPFRSEGPSDGQNADSGKVVEEENIIPSDCNSGTCEPIQPSDAERITAPAVQPTLESEPVDAEESGDAAQRARGAAQPAMKKCKPKKTKTQQKSLCLDYDQDVLDYEWDDEDEDSEDSDLMTPVPSPPPGDREADAPESTAVHIPERSDRPEVPSHRSSEAMMNGETPVQSSSNMAHMAQVYDKWLQEHNHQANHVPQLASAQVGGTAGAKMSVGLTEEENRIQEKWALEEGVFSPDEDSSSDGSIVDGLLDDEN